MPNGVDPAAVPFADAELRAQRRRTLGLGDAPLALFLGSWHEPNLAAVRDVLAAAEALPDARFLVVGSAGLAFADEPVPPNVDLCGVVDAGFVRSVLGARRRGAQPDALGLGDEPEDARLRARGRADPLDARSARAGSGSRPARTTRRSRPGELAAGARRRCTRGRADAVARAHARRRRARARALRLGRDRRALARAPGAARAAGGGGGRVIRVVSVAGGNEVAGARILARDARRAPPGLAADACSCSRACGRRCTRARSRSRSLEPAALAGTATRSRRALPAAAARGARAPAARPPRARRAAPSACSCCPPDAELRGPLDALADGLDEHSGAARAAPARRAAAGRRAPRLARPARRRARSTTSSSRCAPTTPAARSSTGGSSAGARTPTRRGAPTSTPRGRLASPLAAALGELRGRRRGSRTPPTASRTGTSTSARSRTRGSLRFAGFRADRPWWLSEHASRTLVLDDPALAEACGRARAGAARGRLDRRGRGRRRRARAARRARLERAAAAPAHAGARGGRGLRRHLLAGRRARVRALADDARRARRRRPASARYALDPWNERRDLRDGVRRPRGRGRRALRRRGCGSTGAPSSASPRTCCRPPPDGRRRPTRCRRCSSPAT